MRLRTLLIGAFVIAGAALCVRLGLWQLARHHEKSAAADSLRAALAAPPMDLTAATPLASIENRRVRVRGRFDESLHVLLAGRERNGVSGVHVVTPFVLEGAAGEGGQTLAVLVNRGWLAADDAVTAQPSPEPDRHEVTGFATTIRRAKPGYAWRRLTAESDSVTLWSALLLDPDSLAARLHHTFAPFLVTELPGEGVPDSPARAAPEMPNVSMHLGYAIQWFAIAAIVLFFPAWFALAARRKRTRTS